ncbi:MAG: NADH-quinone oxidoreductase subunit N [Cyclobacteriaceae bacterium]|nr:NADH-quinone oxidoreductase subunit N [Cyclobacteriaceae bacterium]
MGVSELLLMRHEWALVAAVLLLLIFEIALPENGKKKINFIAAILVATATIIGFLPAEQGTLFGGMYITDPLRQLMKNILNIGVVLIFLQSVHWLSQDLYKDRSSEFYMLILASLIGVNYMISSGHFLMFYLGLELTTIPIAALASYEQFKSKSAEAGIKLILSSAFSSAILLFGLSVIYANTGSLYFEGFQFSNSLINVLGFIFFFSGLAFKISIVPFHLWTADVYEGSPTNVTSYLSVISKGSAIFILVIVLFTLFNSIQLLWQDVLYATAILTMTIGNLFAIRQQNLKRFLAFSSIAQAGFIMLGVINASSLGMATVIYFIVVYVFSNLAAFGVIQTVGHASGKVTIDDYNGLYKTNPQLSLVMMLALFSLAGIPPLAGFFGKFFLFTAVAESGFYVLLMIAVLNTVISLYYYLLVVKAMFINSHENPIAPFKSDYAMRISLVICVAGILVTGFYSPVFEYIKNLCETF